MNNKIIIQLIKREINELSLLVDALENTTSPRDILIDVTKSKVETLSEVVNFLHKDTSNETALENERPDFEGESEKDIIQSLIEEKQEGKATPPPEPETVNVYNHTEKETIEKAQDKPGPPTNKNNPAQNEEEPTEQVAVEQKETIEETEKIEATEADAPEPDKPQPVINEEKKNNKETASPGDQKAYKKVLGDQFTKEKSLNEKFTSLTETKYKVMGKPVTSVKRAIGLNDRFMFTRELFNNDSGKFNDTVEAIDNANDLVEAVEYLEKNYEWSKNETSLKFMELVKRRFNN
jgi:outer membrane biosynthesis protein TonB